MGFEPGVGLTANEPGTSTMVSGARHGHQAAGATRCPLQFLRFIGSPQLARRIRRAQHAAQIPQLVAHDMVLAIPQALAIRRRSGQ